MTDYKLWVYYHSGAINRELTLEEQREIDAYDLAMHLLIPTKSLLRFLDSLDNFPLVYWGETEFLATVFKVPLEVMEIRLKDLKKNKKIYKDNGERRKVLKKGNAIFLEFK